MSGAGVGGLVAALELWRKGCDVRIFEKAPKSSTAGTMLLYIHMLIEKLTKSEGDTFQIGPSALRFLKHWPEMSKHHEEIAYNPLFAGCKHTGERRNKPGEFSAMVKSKVSTKQNTNAWSGVQHSRPKFHAMLLEQVQRTGIPIEFGRNVVQYYEESDASKGGVVLTDGSKHEASVVVAADGWHGKSWELIAGKPVPAQSSGTAIFRAAYPVELAIRDPLIAERFKLEDDGRTVFELWTGYVDGKILVTSHG